MRKLFAVVLIAFSVSANERSYRSLQSGSATGGTPIHDHGIRGEGQIIAVLDTGLNINSCYFAEADNSPPPANTVDLSRRKVIAYDFLWDNPSAPNAYDNQGHGTHAAAAATGDRAPFGVHDFGDAIAPAAKLIVQDAGFIGGDNCAQRPGIGCPVNLTPILEQAYAQGARIHSNSWGDRQGVPAGFPAPTANYPQSARDVDAFVFTHPDMLVVFNTGNTSVTGLAPASSVSAPGCAKNTLQVGGTRDFGHEAEDDLLSSFSLVGPTLDGRIKPDLVGPAIVIAGDIELDGNPNTCDLTSQPGTSWASPTIAGAAALVRQYYTDGFYPSGVATPANAITPSAALLKATLIAAARPAPWRYNGVKTIAAQPVPSFEQGWGFPVLDDALYFPGDVSRMRVVESSLAQNEISSLRLNVRAGAPLKVVLVWTDPAGSQLVNDLDLRVTLPDGTTRGGSDHVNNVEAVALSPASGIYTIDVTATHLGIGPRQSYALVIIGDIAPPKRRIV
ncbi:MAG TPA: S8 family serine peptidase [Thermoanaerobaculia bacterium]|nr:S8 family serine peptidase [Thermoanaerobaculia bacterium]